MKGRDSLNINRPQSPGTYILDRVGSHWTPQRIADTFLFYGETSKIIGGKLYNQVTGSSDYLTVIGTVGNYHYTCPNTPDYVNADTDKVWFKTDGSVLDVSDSILNSFDLQRTPVKYDDNFPNRNRIIAMIKSEVTVSGNDLNNLYSYFQLSVNWSGIANNHGHVKSNRITQNLWIPELPYPKDSWLGRWDFNGVVLTDTSGNGNDWDSSIDPSLCLDKWGEANKAIDLNGSSQYLRRVSVTILDDVFSVALRFKADAFANHATLFGQPGSGLDTGFAVQCYGSALRFWIGAWNGNTANNKYIDIAFTDTSSWHFLVAMYSKAVGKMYFQLDGGTLNEATVDNTIGYVTTTLNIGHGYTSYFNGQIDQVYWYNRLLTTAEITQLLNYRLGVFKNAEDYGFLTTETAARNVIALQSVVLGGGNTFIKTGSHDMSATVLLDSNTSIFSELGTQLKMASSYCHLFLNRGALTKTLNENISIDGIELVASGNDNNTPLVYGIDGYMAFYYVKNLTIRNFKCVDSVPSLGFFFVRWENVYCDNIYIRGGKAGLNFGVGHHAIVNSYLSETYDDAGALIGVGYPLHTCEVGNVHDILFQNCTDQSYDGSIFVGYHMRALPASWADWNNGNTYRTGNLCLNEGHLYQCDNIAGFSTVGSVAPTHTTGAIVGADTISWRYKQDTSDYAANIYDITYDNHTQTRERAIFAEEALVGVGIYEGCYPGTFPLVNTHNIVIKNSTIVFVNPTIYSFLFVTAWSISNITFVNCHIEGLLHLFDTGDIMGDPHADPRKMNVILTNNQFINCSGFIDMKRWYMDAYVQSSGNTADGVLIIKQSAGGTNAILRLNGTDITIAHNDKNTFSPVIDDLVKDVDGVWKYTAGGWVGI